MKVGDSCQYVDEVGVRHDALITNRWDGKDRDSVEDIDPKFAINVVYVSGDAGERDQYGRQIKRASSVQGRASALTARGRYWE